MTRQQYQALPEDDQKTYRQGLIRWYETRAGRGGSSGTPQYNHKHPPPGIQTRRI